MDEYVTVSCSNCSQPIYLARHRLEARQWNCPACGATNVSTETRRPVSTPAPQEPSRFARAAQTSPAPR